MNAKKAVQEIQARLEARRDFYRQTASALGPGVHREIANEQASMISEALMIVGDVEKLFAS